MATFLVWYRGIEQLACAESLFLNSFGFLQSTCPVQEAKPLLLFHCKMNYFSGQAEPVLKKLV